MEAWALKCIEMNVSVLLRGQNIGKKDESCHSVQESDISGVRNSTSAVRFTCANVSTTCPPFLNAQHLRAKMLR